ncbi:hypothetical protein FKM82_020356 [Ascaphus truei]
MVIKGLEDITLDVFIFVFVLQQRRGHGQDEEEDGLHRVQPEMGGEFYMYLMYLLLFIYFKYTVGVCGLLLCLLGANVPNKHTILP